MVLSTIRNSTAPFSAVEDEGELSDVTINPRLSTHTVSPAFEASSIDEVEEIDEDGEEGERGEGEREEGREEEDKTEGEEGGREGEGVGESSFLPFWFSSINAGADIC